MTDRELLELAAKAVGITLEWDGNPSEWMPMYYEGKTYHAWNPLDDDGDALRLAVKLRLDIVISDDLKHTVARKGFLQMCVEAWGDDENTATRRAIVRVAARIGRAM